MTRSGGAHHRHRAAHQPSRLRKVLTRGFMTLVSVVAVLLTGAGYWVAHGALGGITVSDALSPDDPRSSGDDMNILLIGLDSRKDQDGNDLPWSILKQLHAGDSDDGGYNTNSLILVHVGADGKVVAFHPRDLGAVQRRSVTNHIKIKEAYGLTRRTSRTSSPTRCQQPERTGTRPPKPRRRGNRCARSAQTDRVPIGFFAESTWPVSDLAPTGSVEVCLNHPFPTHSPVPTSRPDARG
jgi:hypothetical protein